MADPVNILACTAGQLVTAGQQRGVAGPAALGLYRRIYREGAAPDPGSWVALDVAPITRREPDGDTMKFVQTLGDGRLSETVIIPSISASGRARCTLCVSSQVGCAMGCVFCETAQMGLLRSLTCAEIVGQWHAARFAEDAAVTNVVFMGMGEPMDNLDTVLRAVAVLADDNGPGVAPSRITISTVGHARGIRTLAERSGAPPFSGVRLAVSINAARDELRGELMPFNRAAALSELKDAMQDWIGAGRGRRILVEYVLIPGVNDAAGDAADLGRYLDRLPCVVNVIPYNPRRDSPWPAPDEHAVRRFTADLHASGLRVHRRRTRGRDAMAACGQLGG